MPHYTNLGTTYLTKEEFIAERRRQESLTPEQRKAETDEFFRKIRKDNNEYSAQKRKEMEERSLKEAENAYIYTDTVNSLENSEATVIWIIVMLVASIFKGNWIIWIIATVIWFNYINRYARRRAEWEEHGKAEWMARMNYGGEE